MAIFAEYRERNALLKNLGFASYKAYLDSSLWCGIRKRVFKAHNGKCAVCRGRARQVHHMNYSREALLGKSLLHFLPLCKPCHQAAEVDQDTGEKRHLGQANAILERLSLRRFAKKKPPKSKRSSNIGYLRGHRTKQVPELTRREKKQKQRIEAIKKENSSLMSKRPKGPVQGQRTDRRGESTAIMQRPKRRTPLSVLTKGPLAERLQARLHQQTAQLGGNTGATPSSIT